MVAVAGVAGSGKTTLGRALAKTLGAPLLDLDTMTNPLLDSLPAEALGGHWLASPHRATIRDGRYAALLTVAVDVVATAGTAVLVAPFTAELQKDDAWNRLRTVADVRVVHLTGAPDLFAERRADRGADRDRHRAPDGPSTPPSIPVISVDAELTTEQQLLRVLVALDRRSPVEAPNPLFAAGFDAVLFDIDGTLADSTASVLRSWRRFATEHGIPAKAVADNHGRPARHLIDLLLPADKAEAGLARITAIEIEDAVTVRPTPGALDLFGSLPDSRRAVVTSCSAPLARARMAAAGLVTPPVTVTADDVRTGKPDPEPYLLAAERLGVDPARCLAVEDAAAGIRSALAAGCTVLAVTGTSAAAELKEADLVVDGLDRVRFASRDGRIHLIVGPGNGVERSY
ncbi:HAD-IA family hydrolase [Actinoplanes sp. NBRC 101535]|uniref:HAD-IA family hydrolase n=1 Tax=Actinoplanes sp. NBRC 101535 TaxID=3032196 RepID=UPI0024A52DE8|nr:HAD-IA family hydrolase [Actinoplanes sp. NBRC 101535]GLY04510.1 hypothetical protein Acsp01_48890 [Actinoplanes sp. NBRC 101535]